MTTVAQLEVTSGRFVSRPDRRQQQTPGSGLVELLPVQRSLHYLHEAGEGLAEQDGPLCVTVWCFRNSRGEVDTPVVQSGSGAEPGVGARVEVFGGGKEDAFKRGTWYS